MKLVAVEAADTTISATEIPFEVTSDRLAFAAIGFVFGGFALPEMVAKNENGYWVIDTTDSDERNPIFGVIGPDETISRQVVDNWVATHSDDDDSDMYDDDV